MTKSPVIYARCEVCDDEWCMHPIEEVRLVGGDTWMCQTCYEDCDEPPQHEWKTLPQASEWVTVREAPAEKQMCLHAHGVSANNRCLNCGKDMR